MVSSRLALGALAVACMAAASVGGYVASRQNAVPAPAVAATPSTLGAEATAPGVPVQETEAAVTARAPVAPRRASTSVAAPAGSASSRRPEAQTTPQPARSIPSRSSREPLPADRADAQSPAARSPLPSTTPAPATVDNIAIATPPVEERAPLDVPRAPEPPEKTFEEIVVASNSVVGLQTETRISSETARVEDRVEARVTRDVRVGDVVAIPAGSRAIGTVIQVERGGKFKDRARLGIRFTSLVLADGTQMSIGTETIYREGEAPGNGSAAKIGGGAVGGAILGAILGGAKGAAIGATAGAGGGAAVVQAGDRSEVTLPAGSPLTVRLMAPLTVTVEKQ
ncbi:MAG TPA: TrbI/VirB10 family protein [Vicinamibacterales bacterium]|nr:TrbI/VirB10 family protein [Vicinamibacterales bacterium]